MTPEQGLQRLRGLEVGDTVRVHPRAYPGHDGEAARRGQLVDTDWKDGRFRVLRLFPQYDFAQISRDAGVNWFIVSLTDLELVVPHA